MAGSCESDAEAGWEQTQNSVEGLGERRRRLRDPIDVEELEQSAVV